MGGGGKENVKAVSVSGRARREKSGFMNVDSEAKGVGGAL